MAKKFKKFILKNKLVVAIVLLTEAVTLLVFFIAKAVSKKDFVAALLATSTLSATLGTVFLVSALLDKKDRRICAKQEKEMLQNPNSFQIITDDNASEKEFKD